MSSFNWPPMTASSVSFPLQAPDGSAAAPSYAFTNSVSTGLFEKTTGQWGLSAAGTEVLNATSSLLTASVNMTLGTNSLTANSVIVGSAANRISGLSTIINTGTLTLPTSTDTLVGRATTDTLTNKTLTAPQIATIVNTGTLTLPTSTDTLVGRATTDTLTNKTLTAPVIATIVNTGTLTLPTATDTLVARTTTDTLTNKTISGSSNTLSNIADGSLTTPYIKADGSRALTADWAAGAFKITAAAHVSNTANAAASGIVRLANADAIAWRNSGNSADISLALSTNTLQFNGVSLVDVSTAQTLTNKTLTTPIISSISNSGTITIPTGTLTLATLTGTETLTNKTLTLPIISSISNSGTITVPTGSDTLVGRATTDTLTNKTLTSPIVSGIYLSYVAKTTTYTATSTDDVISVDTSGGAWTLTLPAASAGKKRLVIVKSTTDFNACTISRAGSDTIGFSGATTTTVNTIGEALELLSDGTSKWVIVNRKTEVAPTTYSLTIGGSTTPPTKGTMVTDIATWWRQGNQIFLRYEFRQSGIGSSAAGSGTYLFPLPNTSVLTLDSTNNNPSTGDTSDNFYGTGVLTFSTSSYLTSVKYFNSTNVWFSVYDVTTSNTPFIFGSASFSLNTGSLIQFSYLAQGPISQWNA